MQIIDKEALNSTFQFLADMTDEELAERTDEAVGYLYDALKTWVEGETCSPLPTISMTANEAVVDYAFGNLRFFVWEKQRRARLAQLAKNSAK